MSYAETVIDYKEKNCGRVVDGLMKLYGESEGRMLYQTYDMRINSKGRLDINLSNYRISDDQKDKLSARKKLPTKKYKAYAHVTFNSKGKKKVNAAYDVYRKSWTKYVYGNHLYGVTHRKLIVHSKNGKVLKTIKPNLSKYLEKNHTAYLMMVEVAGKSKVRLFYLHSYNYRSPNGGTGYGGIIEVNTKTGKVKKLVSTKNYVPRCYDGKYVYGFKIRDEEVKFFRTSLKTQKTETFKTQAIISDNLKNWEESAKYTFYNGNIMGLSPDGKVLFGTFKDKKFEQVGDISKCKNYKKYCALSIAMKSKKEFYIMYDPNIEAHEEPEGMRERLIIVQYKNKEPE